MGMEMVIFNESPPFTLPYEPFGRNTGREEESRVGDDGGGGGGGWGDGELAGKRGGEESAVLLIRAPL